MYNPGSLECVHLDEYGPGNEKGFYHVLVDEGNTRVNYIPSSYRTVVKSRIDLSGSGTVEEAYELIMAQLEKAGPLPGSQVQVLLQGEVPYSPLLLDSQYLTGLITEKFNPLYVEIINQTNLPKSKGTSAGTLPDRTEMERLVFGELMTRERVWAEESLNEAVLVVQQLKEMVLAGEKEAELLELLKERADLLKEPQEEVPDSPQEGVGA